MGKIYYILLLAACMWIFVDCQGGRGRGGGGRGGRSGSRSGSRGGGSSCSSEGCRQRQRTIMYWIFGGGAGCICIYGISRWCKGRPLKDNATFVNSSSEMQSLIHSKHHNVFQTGIWTSRYLQYGVWQGPYESLLSFDNQTMKITGWGWDNIGKFTVVGKYSEDTRRMGLTKTYQPGTGDLIQNLGHNVVIQVTESSPKQFEGKWYVRTSKYSGQDSFELKFHRERECEADVPTTQGETGGMHVTHFSHLFEEYEK